MDAHHEMRTQAAGFWLINEVWGLSYYFEVHTTGYPSIIATGYALASVTDSIGSRTVKVVPTFGVLSTSIVPRC